CIRGSSVARGIRTASSRLISSLTRRGRFESLAMCWFEAPNERRSTGPRTTRTGATPPCAIQPCASVVSQFPRWPSGRASLDGARHLDLLVYLDLIADLHVVVVL